MGQSKQDWMMHLGSNIIFSWVAKTVEVGSYATVVDHTSAGEPSFCPSGSGSRRHVPIATNLSSADLLFIVKST